MEGERARASLSSEEIALFDFKAKQAEVEAEAELARQVAETKFQEEQNRIERQRKIYEAFQQLEIDSVEDLEALKKAEFLE